MTPTLETRAASRPVEPRAASRNGIGLDDNVYQSLLQNRIIFLGSEVKDENANAICAQMLLLNAEDPHKDIYLYINSPGGSVDSGMAIYDTMNWIPNDVATVAMGLAASMGQFLLCAGTKGKRYALPHSRIMMHQPSGGLGGTASDIRIQAEQSLHIKTVMQRLIAEHTGQTLEQIEADSDRDRWFTAEDALALRTHRPRVRLRRADSLRRSPEPVKDRIPMTTSGFGATVRGPALRPPPRRPALRADDGLLHPAVGRAHLVRDAPDRSVHRSCSRTGSSSSAPRSAMRSRMR